MTDISFSLRPELTLTTRRCWECGQWYGFEPHRECGCPRCKTQSVTNLLAMIDERDKTIAALKGALTKAKRK